MIMQGYLTERKGTFVTQSYRAVVTGSGVVGETTVSASNTAYAGMSVLGSIYSQNNGKNRVIESPHEYVKTSYRGWSGTMMDRWNTSPLVYEDFFTGEFGLADIIYPQGWNEDLTEAYNSALGELVSQIRGNVDLSIDILQSGQTKSMVQGWYNAIKKLGKTVREIRKYPLKAMANARLQYMYGLKPTLSTMYELGNNTYGQFSKPTIIRGRGSATTETFGSASSALTRTCNNMSTLKRRTTVEMRATYKKPDSVIANLQNYTSLNPASIVYELIPFSFVLDWMWDYGSYLRNLESSFTLSPFVSNLGVSTLTVSDIRAAASGQTEGGTIRRINVGGQVKRVKFSRTTHASIPVPYLPSFGGNLGLDRGFNSIALLRQLTSPIDSKLRLIR